MLKFLLLTKYVFGVNTLIKIGVVLNFSQKTLTIDHHKTTVRPMGAFYIL